MFCFSLFGLLVFTGVNGGLCTLVCLWAGLRFFDGDVVLCCIFFACCYLDLICVCGLGLLVFCILRLSCYRFACGYCGLLVLDCWYFGLRD